jgi:hypothetical protein
MYYAKKDKDKWRAYGMDLYWPSVTMAYGDLKKTDTIELLVSGEP